MERAVVENPVKTPSPDKNQLVQKLQQEVYALQRQSKDKDQTQQIDLGPILSAFPNKTFPIGAVHEFISYEAENAAATNGFITALSGKLMRKEGACLWIGAKRTLFPSALQKFGINPDRIIFIDLTRQIDILWAMEEALKCKSLSAVIGELNEITFNQSRRLQLAVEQSNVTGIIHRHKPRIENTVACVARWRISTSASNLEGSLPGVGYPKWHINIDKVRNGRPGAWDVEMNKYRFLFPTEVIISATHKRKAG